MDQEVLLRWKPWELLIPSGTCVEYEAKGQSFCRLGFQHRFCWRYWDFTNLWCSWTFAFDKSPTRVAEPCEQGSHSLRRQMAETAEMDRTQVSKLWLSGHFVGLTSYMYAPYLLVTFPWSGSIHHQLFQQIRSAACQFALPGRIPQHPRRCPEGTSGVARKLRKAQRIRGWITIFSW